MNILTTTSAAPPTRILIAEDEPEIRDYLQLALRRPNFVIDVAEDGEEVLSCLEQAQTLPALVIMDVAMPRKDGIATLKDLRQTHPNLPVIMLSGLSSTANVVEAMRSGAVDFLTKPVSHEALRQAVDHYLPAAPVKRQNQPHLVDCSASNVAIAGWTQRVQPLLDRIAGSDVPVLLEGETGSGKEVLARRIHNQSLRAGEVFLKLNCAALPSELVESELFGYERGSFTGAFKSNPGKFELANRGTILLDEIGDMDLKLQAKLLQVLQDQEFSRIGAKETTRVDVRVIAATHRDLQARIIEGTFREDLYYRLNIVRIVIPPLRDRTDELIPLASLFLKKHRTASQPIPVIGPALRTAILSHSWPGNVRELENLMRQYIVVGDPDFIIAEIRSRIDRENRGKPRSSYSAPAVLSNVTLPAAAPVPSPEPPVCEIDADEAASAAANGRHSHRSADAVRSNLAKVDQARKTAEMGVIIEALNATLWNRKRAAAQLGIDYKALLYKMKKLGIG